MFDIGWSELLVIGVVALIVVGPKDLPQMFRTLGRFTAKARSMAREFSRAMEDAADEAGVKDVARDLKSATSARSLGLDKVEEAVTRFEQWNPMDDRDDGEAKPARGATTEALGKERAEVAEKIRDAGARAALERRAKEAGASEAGARTPAAKKPAAKKPAAKKPAAKKPAAKKPAAKKAPARKPAAKKPAGKTGAKSGAGAGGKGV